MQNEKKNKNPFEVIEKFKTFLSKRKGSKGFTKKYDAKEIIERARKRVTCDFKPPKLC